MNTPDQNARSLFPEPEKDDLSTYAQRQLIGGIGMVLPALLWLIAGWRPIEVLHRWEPLSSISAYYYTGAVSVFAGGLIALAVFLFSCRGYKNNYGYRDRVAAIIAGGAAVLVAFFPTRAPNDLLRPPWWTPLLGSLHHWSAVVLFGSFIFFSLVQFPRSKLDKANLPPDKRARNWIYITCGVAMLVCIAWAVIALWIGRSIFWPETLALEFFAVSWLVKGRADRTPAATLHYGRRHLRSLEQAWSAMRGKRLAGPKAPQNGA